jgi:hypothetical protein
VLVQSGPDGRVNYSALVARVTPTSRALEGLQVAWAEDGGASWGANAYLGPAEGALTPDRQWLGFGEDGLVYLSYNQPPSGIWVARSDDGGATWGPFVPAAPSALCSGAFGQAGPPVVDASGRVHIPATTFDGRVLLFSSANGIVWSSTTVIAQQAGMLPAWFPIAVADGDTIHVAAWYVEPLVALGNIGGDSGRIVVASSADGGVTWSNPTTWAEGAATSAWLLARAGELELVWYRADEESRALVATRGDASGPREEAVAWTGIPAGARGANTDFAHATRGADGRLAVVWSAPDQGVWVQRGP